MSNGYLTTREFERWTREQDKKSDRILDGIDDLRNKDADHGARIRVLETEVANVKPTAKSTSVKWSAGVTTVLTIIVQAVLGALGVK